MDRRGYLAPGVVVWAASGLDVDGPNAGVLLLTLPTHSLPEQLCPLAALSLPPDLSFSQKSLPLLPELPPPS